MEFLDFLKILAYSLGFLCKRMYTRMSWGFLFRFLDHRNEATMVSTKRQDEDRKPKKDEGPEMTHHAFEEAVKNSIVSKVKEIWRLPLVAFLNRRSDKERGWLRPLLLPNSPGKEVLLLSNSSGKELPFSNDEEKVIGMVALILAGARFERYYERLAFALGRRNGCCRKELHIWSRLH
jgi:hypothetical protein